MDRGTCSEPTFPSVRDFKGVGDGFTGVDEHGGGRVQACPLMKGGEASNTHTTAGINRDDVAVPSLHSSGQVIEIVLDVVSISICNYTRINLNEGAMG